MVSIKHLIYFYFYFRFSKCQKKQTNKVNLKDMKYNDI